MRLVTYLPPTLPQDGTSYARAGDGRAGALVEEDRVLDLAAAAEAAGEQLPSSMLGLIEAGPSAWQIARELVDEAPEGSLIAEAPRLLAPLPNPPSLRDFYAFEDHVRAGFARRGEDIPPPWFDLPVYYLTNHRSILGPGETIPWPTFTEELDYEAEIAMVVGVGGRNIAVDDAAAHVFGYTIYNDCSARDLQRQEMQVRLGPARSKGFAQVLGPCIVTADEVDPLALHVRAWLDDELVTDTSTDDMRWTFPQMISMISEGEDVVAGDVYGSGTVSGGCGLEHGHFPQPGGSVTIDVAGIGRLHNPVGRRTAG